MKIQAILLRALLLRSDRLIMAAVNTHGTGGMMCRNCKFPIGHCEAGCHLGSYPCRGGVSPTSKLLQQIKSLQRCKVNLKRIGQAQPHPYLALISDVLSAQMFCYFDRPGISNTETGRGCLYLLVCNEPLLLVCSDVLQVSSS